MQSTTQHEVDRKEKEQLPPRQFLPGTISRAL
jgi:hypothetical protein